MSACRFGFGPVGKAFVRVLICTVVAAAASSNDKKKINESFHTALL